MHAGNPKPCIKLFIRLNSIIHIDSLSPKQRSCQPSIFMSKTLNVPPDFVGVHVNNEKTTAIFGAKTTPGRRLSPTIQSHVNTI